MNEARPRALNDLTHPVEKLLHEEPANNVSPRFLWCHMDILGMSIIQYTSLYSGMALSHSAYPFLLENPSSSPVKTDNELTLINSDDNRNPSERPIIVVCPHVCKLAGNWFIICQDDTA